MNSHGHDERLSAFYDGELPAVERAEVERLLAENPELQAELAGMSDLSQRLSDLADEGTDFDLRPGVMEAIRKSGGRREAGADKKPGLQVPAGVSVDQPSSVIHPPHSGRRWMPLVLMVCSLGLLVAAILPLMPTTDSLVAVNDPAPEGTISNVASAVAPTEPEMHAHPMAKSGEGIALKAETDHSNGLVVAMDLPAAPGNADLGGIGGLAPPERDPSELLKSIAEKRRLNPGELIKQLVEVGGQAMLAEYQVVDVRRSFSQVEVLLKDKGIVPLEAEEKRADDGIRDAKSSLDNLRIIVVDSEPTPLNEVLVQFVASPENSEVMVTNLDSVALMEEVQELALGKDGLAMQGAADSPSGQAEEHDAPVAATDQRVDDAPPRLSKTLPEEKAQNPAAAIPLPAPITAEQVDQSKGKILSKMVIGNSVTIGNGDEVYPVLEEAAKNAYNRQYSANPADSNTGRAGKPGSSNAYTNAQSLAQRRASPVDLFSQNAYGQRSFNRMRQLAILVLKPKPVPEPQPGFKGK